MLDATKIERLALDNEVSLSTGHRNVREALAVVRAQAPDLEEALDAAREAGYHHVMIDGTVIATDRSRAIGPARGVDLWWSGPPSRRQRPSPHRPGWLAAVDLPGPTRARARQTWVRAHDGLLDAVDAWRKSGGVILADLGYQGESERMIVSVKKGAVELSVDQKCFNALLKVTFAALRHVTVSPERIGDIAAAALAILHVEHHRTA